MSFVDPQNTSSTPKNATETILTALEAHRRGFTPVAIRSGSKAPYGASWQLRRFETENDVRDFFEKAAQEDAPGIGLALGEASGGLLDIDLDHPHALRLKDYFLPQTPMQSGRNFNPRSHRWYVADNLNDVTTTKQYKMPNGAMVIELRGNGAQTVIPPSMWHPKTDPRTGAVKDPSKGSAPEPVEWFGPAWGGEEGPAVVDGRKLAVQVATLHLTALLMEKWPEEGGRHAAYLALAGGLLRLGEGVHPFWEGNLASVIRALAEVTHDEDADTRVAESVGSTLAKIRRGDNVQGFPTLEEAIGAEYCDAVRRAAREVEYLAGYSESELRSLRASRQNNANRVDDDEELIPAKAFTVNFGEAEPSLSFDDSLTPITDPVRASQPFSPLAGRNPMEERLTPWSHIELGPYLSGEIVVADPEVLTRTDGVALFYPGRVNSIFGSSESAKTWVMMFACSQEIAKGERVAYLDFEDEPAGVVDRLTRLQIPAEDIRLNFGYVHPDGPLAPMQRGPYGPRATDAGEESNEDFLQWLDDFDPTLIVIDGMTMLYGLHGLDTNGAADTDVIKGWLFSLTRGGRSTVVVIDHTGKTSGPGASPLGAHHKIAMIQGTALRAEAIERPMPGEKGRIKLTTYKDRLGKVRAHSAYPHGNSSEQIAGIVHIDSTVEGVTTMKIEPHAGAKSMEGEANTSGAALTVLEGAMTQQALGRLAAQEDAENEILGLFHGDLEARLTMAELMEMTGKSRATLRTVIDRLFTQKRLASYGTTKDRAYGLR